MTTTAPILADGQIVVEPPIDDHRLIRTRFNLALSKDGDADELICILELPQVPDLGETINLGGNPFSVIERSWSTFEPTNNPLPASKLYAYVRVMRKYVR